MEGDRENTSLQPHEDLRGICLGYTQGGVLTLGLQEVTLLNTGTQGSVELGIELRSSIRNTAFVVVLNVFLEGVAAEQGIYQQPWEDKVRTGE